MTQSGMKLQFRDAYRHCAIRRLADDLRWSAGKTLIKCLAEKASLSAVVRRARPLTWPRQPILTIPDEITNAMGVFEWLYGAVKRYRLWRKSDEAGVTGRRKCLHSGRYRGCLLGDVRNRGGGPKSITCVCVSVCKCGCVCVSVLSPPVCEVSPGKGPGCWYMMLIRTTISSVRVTGSNKCDCETFRNAKKLLPWLRNDA